MAYQDLGLYRDYYAIAHCGSGLYQPGHRDHTDAIMITAKVSSSQAAVWHRLQVP